MPIVAAFAGFLKKLNTTLIYTVPLSALRAYLSFYIHLSTSSSDVLFEMGQSKPMRTRGGFIQMGPQVQKVMLVGCDWQISIRLVCLARRKMDDMSIESSYRIDSNKCCGAY